MKELQNRPVKGFWPIDRLSEGSGAIRPNYDQTFYFHSEFYGDHSENFIIIKDKTTGKITETWNIKDISNVEYL